MDIFRLMFVLPGRISGFMMLLGLGLLAIPAGAAFMGFATVQGIINADPTGKGFDAGSESRCMATTPVAQDHMTFVKGRDDNNIFLVQACAAGTSIEIGISSSAPRSILTFDQAADLGLKPNRLSFEERHSNGKTSVAVARATLPALQVGDIEMKNFEVLIARDHDIEYGVLGKDFLGKLKSHKVVLDDWLIMIPR